MIKKKKFYKMTFEVTCKFKNLIDEQTFKKEYGANLLKLCQYMYKMENVGFFDEPLKLVKAKFVI